MLLVLDDLDKGIVLLIDIDFLGVVLIDGALTVVEFPGEVSHRALLAISLRWNNKDTVLTIHVLQETFPTTDCGTPLAIVIEGDKSDQCCVVLVCAFLILVGWFVEVLTTRITGFLVCLCCRKGICRSETAKQIIEINFCHNLKLY